MVKAPCSGSARIRHAAADLVANLLVFGALFSRAHVMQDAYGAYIEVERGAAQPMSGFAPFGDEHACPDLGDLDGRRAGIAGVLVWKGQPLIVMTDPTSWWS